jgi:hypothetical protein
MTVVVSIDDSVVATLSGSRFSGNITVAGTGSFEQGISGSLTQLVDGSSYLVAGSNVTITSASNGQVTIAATTVQGGAPTDAQYVTLGTNSSLSAERVLTPGQDILLTDAGAGNTATLSLSRAQISDEIIRRLAGTRMFYVYYDASTISSYNWMNFAASYQYSTITRPALANTNQLTRSTRWQFNTAASANSQAGVWERNAITLRQDGFVFVAKFGFATWAAANRQSFCGLQPSTSFPISSTTQPSALTDMVGVGMNSGDTALYIMHNDGSGTATKVSTGAAASTTTFYMLILMCDAGGDIKYIFRNLGARTEVTGTLTTDLPTLSTGMAATCVWCPGSTATAVAGVINSMLVNNTIEINLASSF